MHLVVAQGHEIGQFLQRAQNLREETKLVEGEFAMQQIVVNLEWRQQVSKQGQGPEKGEKQTGEPSQGPPAGIRTGIGQGFLLP